MFTDGKTLYCKGWLIAIEIALGLLILAICLVPMIVYVLGHFAKYFCDFFAEWEDGVVRRMAEAQKRYSP